MTYLIIYEDQDQREIIGPNNLKDALILNQRMFEDVDELAVTAIQAVPDDEPEEMVRIYNKFCEKSIAAVWAMFEKCY